MSKSRRAARCSVCAVELLDVDGGWLHPPVAGESAIGIHDEKWDVMPSGHHTGPPVSGSDTTVAIRTILNEAADIYDKRQPAYGDQWRKYGWRGALYSARRKVERAWAQMWDATPGHPVEADDEEVSGVDDLLDSMVYLAMCVHEARKGNRDGEGQWW